jgi:hypothetical protein
MKRRSSLYTLVTATYMEVFKATTYVNYNLFTSLYEYYFKLKINGYADLQVE